MDTDAHFSPRTPRVALPARAPQRECDFLAHDYTFLNRRAKITAASGGIDWEFHGHGGLWLDQLHYLRYFDAVEPTLRPHAMRAIASWLEAWADHVASHPATKALHPPYNASERAFSLGRFLARHPETQGTELAALAQRVIARDLDYVARNLEFHLDGNHLLKNLLSLAWGACLFDGHAAARWRSVAGRQLPRALAQQVLADGMHYERSPMYHNNALVDLLDVVNVMKDGAAREVLVGFARRMLAAAAMLTHPDGNIAFFNDSALDGLPPSRTVIGYGHALCGTPDPVTSLPDAGFYLLDAGEHAYVVADAGALGPDEQMGHAHSDAFSFEMSAYGERVLVNTGTSTYYDLPYRDYERSADAHNTVTVPGGVQADHWSFFRVAERARPREVSFAGSGLRGGTALSGELPLLGDRPRLTHRREFKASAAGTLSIADRVAPAIAGAVANFHFAPQVRVASGVGGRTWTATLASGRRVSLEVADGDAELAACEVATRFNSRVPSRRLGVRLAGGAGASRSLVAISTPASVQGT